MESIRPDIDKMLKEKGMTPHEFVNKCCLGELGCSVTDRVKSVKQPYGGFLPAGQLTKTPLGEGEGALSPEENVHGSLIGLAVDYMTRVLLGTPVNEAFGVSLDGAEILEDSLPGSRAVKKARTLAAGIKGLNKESLTNAIKLVAFDVCMRSGPAVYKPVEEVNPDVYTLYNIRTMVERSLHFFELYGPKVLDGFRFEGGYTLTVTTGDGDFTTSDTLWDFKVSRGSITKNQTLQLLMYWRMGLHSIHPEFQSITFLGIYNPRKNVVARIKVSDIPVDVIATVERDVIGY